MAASRSHSNALVTFLLIALLSVGLAAFFYVIGGQIFLAMLAALVVFAVLEALHYVVWGRSERRAARVERPQAPHDPRTPPNYRG